MPNWYPGLNAAGQHPFADVVGFTRGFWSQPPTVTTPGTTASGSAVANSTGFDCVVYASATTSIGKVVLNGGTIPGTAAAAANNLATFYVPSGQTLALTYTGTLTWLWLAA